jgi:sulfatase modifying factor 1
MKKISILQFLTASFVGAFTLTHQVQAQSPLVSIDTVTVGDAGNAADVNGYGAVADVFAIGKYEVTISQYTAFLNSVASVTSDNYIVDLWNPNMQTDLNIAGISRIGSGTLADPYNYSVIGPFGVTPPGASSSGNRPISFVSWFDAARFANWMNNGAINGASTEIGAYTLNGATNGIITVNPGATWFLPSGNQWYKSAYYKGGGTNAGYWLYPTQNDAPPSNIIGNEPNAANSVVSYDGAESFTYSVAQTDIASDVALQNLLTEVGAYTGSSSTYGTYDQGGNVEEWNDSIANTGGGKLPIGPLGRGTWGGGWNNLNNELTAYDTMETASSLFVRLTDSESSTIGFRVATVPEPSTYALLLLSGAASLWSLRRRKS